MSRTNEQPGVVAEMKPIGGEGAWSGSESGALLETVLIGSEERRPGISLIREVRQDMRDFWNGRGVIRQFVGTTLQVRYQNSVLGLFWTLLHPLGMLGIMSVVFGHVLRFGLPNYPVFLFAGLIPWQFFSAAVGQGSMSLVTHQGLIRKINVRLFMFPISDLAIAAVHNLIAFGAIFILMMLMFRVSPGADGVLPHGAALTPHLLLVPLGLVMLYVFTLGVTLIAMTLTTYFRDMEHIISVGMQALYFATPIFFRTQDVPKLKPFIEANPLTWILAFFQDGIYHHQWPDLRYWIVAPVSALIVFGFGYVVYKKHEYEYIFRL